MARLVLRVEADQLPAQAEVGQQFHRVPRVLCGNQWHRLQDVQGPKGDVVEVANGGGDQVEHSHPRRNPPNRTRILGVGRASRALAPVLLAYAPTGALAAVLVAAFVSSHPTSQSASSGRWIPPCRRPTSVSPI